MITVTVGGDVIMTSATAGQEAWTDSFLAVGYPPAEIMQPNAQSFTALWM